MSVSRRKSSRYRTNYDRRLKAASGIRFFYRLLLVMEPASARGVCSRSGSIFAGMRASRPHHFR